MTRPRVTLTVQCTGRLLWIVALLSAAPATAQDPEPAVRAWLAAGVGSGGASDGAGGIAALIQLSVLQAPHQLSLRVAGAAPLLYPGGSASDISVTYSRAMQGRSGHLSIGGGLGLTSRDACNAPGPECDPERAPALAFAAEGMLRVLPVFGLGVHAFANTSRLGYMGGFAFVAQIGWLPR